MSIFDLDQQNNDLNSKIIAGLERLSQVFRTLLWEKAKEHQLSPIQIQILTFIAYHAQDLCTVTYLAQEFRVTKPTISDAVKVLVKKNLLRKKGDNVDGRSYYLSLTKQGKVLVNHSEDFAQPLMDIIQLSTLSDRKILWLQIAQLIENLHRMGIISVQRTCHACRHYKKEEQMHYCNLLQKHLQDHEIRIDCDEFEVSA